MSLLVREFEEADREALRRLYQASRDAAFTWAPREAHHLLDFDTHTDRERILVALMEGVVVGFASIWEAGSFLHNLFVHPGHLGQGVGKALLRECANHFKAPPTLKCLKANAHAFSFYVAQGWRAISEGESPEGCYFLMSSMVQAEGAR